MEEESKEVGKTIEASDVFTKNTINQDTRINFSIAQLCTIIAGIASSFLGVWYIADAFSTIKSQSAETREKIREIKENVDLISTKLPEIQKLQLEMDYLKKVDSVRKANASRP